MATINKYTKWYYSIIEIAKSRDLTSNFEKHHILPKSLGGNNEKENLVKLTRREHFICHQLLIKMTFGDNRQKMLHAVWRLAHVAGQKITSRRYEQLKTQRSLAMTGRKNPKVSAALSGRKVPQEVIEKRLKKVIGQKRPSTSAALKGRKNPKVSESLSGRIQPRELVEKRAQALRGKPSGAAGRKQSDEEKKRRSEIMKGRPSPHKGKPWSEKRRNSYLSSLKGKNAAEK
jgi:hypothetical protein